MILKLLKEKVKTTITKSYCYDSYEEYNAHLYEMNSIGFACNNYYFFMNYWYAQYVKIEIVKEG